MGTVKQNVLLLIRLMAFTTDQVFEKIGSFGRYQILLLIYANLLVCFWFAWPTLLATFIAAEPGWRCVENGNNSECKVNGTVYPSDENFDHRCDIAREAWEFVDDYTSVVTEVTGTAHSHSHFACSNCSFCCCCSPSFIQVVKMLSVIKESSF